MSAINSFQARVKNAINGTYHSSMRRSIQALVLYEADRCLKDRYSSLKPFQQKYALLATATDLLETFDFLDDSAKEEIMLRGNARKGALVPVQAWRRMKSITKEVDQTFLPKAKVLMEDEGNHGKNHDEICEMLLQSMYEEKSSDTTKPRPPMWEYNHNHTFVVYRVYFRELALDTDLVPATPPRVVDVPDKKPGHQAPLNDTSVRGTDEAVTATLSSMTLAPGKKGKNNAKVSDEQRRMLKELKHLIAEFMESFEGVIPEDELKKRQRVMYAKLRPGRLISGAKNKKQKQQKKKNAEAMGAGISEEVTELINYENVGSNGAKKQQRKAMRQAKRGGAKKQKKAERGDNIAKVGGEGAVIEPLTTDEGWEKKWARLEQAKKQQKRAMRQAKRGKKGKEVKVVIKPETMDDA